MGDGSTDWGLILSNAEVALVSQGEERAESKKKALILPIFTNIVPI